jgi:hypothetical protein
MAHHQRSTEDLEAAYTLLLLSQNPVQFITTSTPATTVGIEQWDAHCACEEGRKSNAEKENAPIHPHARFSRPDHTCYNGESLKIDETNMAMLGTSLRMPDGNDYHSEFTQHNKGDCTCEEPATQVNEVKLLAQNSLNGKGELVKIHKEKWTAAEVDTLKSNASLLKRPGSMTEQRRATLATLFPNRSVWALHSKLCKIKVAEAKAARELQVASDRTEKGEFIQGDLDGLSPRTVENWPELAGPHG